MTQVTQKNTGLSPRNTINKGAPKSQNRGRGWNITFNTYDTVLISTLKDHDCEVIAFQSETGKKTGHDHLQCVIWYKNPRYFGGIKKVFPKAHIELARKNLTANINYCTKADTWNEKVRYHRAKGKVILDIDEASNGENRIIVKEKMTYEDWSYKFIEDASRDPGLRYWFRKMFIDETWEESTYPQ